MSLQPARQLIWNVRRKKERFLDYNEDLVLTRYVWVHYERLMSDFERRVGRAVLGRMKAASPTTSVQMAELLNRQWGAVGDAEIEEALIDGIEEFRRKVRNRLLSDWSAEVFVNRCPMCMRVVRTPQAQQCFWCGYDWHTVVEPV